ncbi:uncharacterized protein FTOL_13548 [Fusarium torulosum]|uniref:Uncharacterized protein n=1 Tax=Fusarium torulosum TaxID=33205 RepID=A0AAE8SQC7_9HYPO|nr:uncharacterized protein FTOL_13548 [Fusarium torulosum]
MASGFGLGIGTSSNTTDDFVDFGL